METPLRTTIQTRLAQLLVGELAFDDFWDWLSPLKRHPEATGETRRLLFQIIGRLYEYERGDWTDEELRERLLALLPPDLARDVRRADIDPASSEAGLSVELTSGDIVFRLPDTVRITVESSPPRIGFPAFRTHGVDTDAVAEALSRSLESALAQHAA